MQKVWMLLIYRRAGSVGSASASYAGSIPDWDKPKSYKQVVKAPLLNARQRVWELQVLGVDHKKNGCPYHSRHDTLKKRHYSIAMSAEDKSKLKLFTGNGGVYIWVKNVQKGRNTPQKNKHIYVTIKTEF